MTWLAETEAHPLIASCALHYELEFIHPFADGNGRMGRLWQTVILSRWQPVMAFLPVETVINARQDHYYQQLSQADRPLLGCIVGQLGEGLGGADPNTYR